MGDEAVKIRADSATLTVEQRRLLWRCRRGMLELDIVLKRFITHHYAALSIDELQIFDAWLDLPDQIFWQLISAEQTTVSEQESQLLEKIRTQ